MGSKIDSMPAPKKQKRKSKRKTKDNILWVNDLGARIKELRLKGGKSQSDLASLVEMDSQGISRLERGIVTPSAYVIKQICRALEVSLAEFYKPLED